MRSIVGVGMTPPKVLGTPKPASSVMMSSTFGAPLGGTILGAHQALDCRAPSLMIPPNFGSGGGSCLPVIDVVALEEPSTPLTSCASAVADHRRVSVSVAVLNWPMLMTSSPCDKKLSMTPARLIDLIYVNKLSRS